VRSELLEFYANPSGPNATKRKPKVWSKVEAELQQLKNSAPAPVSAGTSPSAP
jgi:hypothetical protein